MNLKLEIVQKLNAKDTQNKPRLIAFDAGSSESDFQSGMFTLSETFGVYVNKEMCSLAYTGKKILRYAPEKNRPAMTFVGIDSAKLKDTAELRDQFAILYPYLSEYKKLPAVLDVTRLTLTDVAAQAIFEGLFLASYTFDKYKTDKKSEVASVIVPDPSKKLAAPLKKANLLMQAVFFTRNLQNEPSANLTPLLFSQTVKKMLTPKGVKTTVMDEKQMKKLKMGGILGVGQGSVNPPCMVVAEYRTSKKNAQTIAIVGKGVTFDTGGISLKPADSMWKMKGDMSGAASVAGILLAASLFKIPLNIIGIMPLAENMPSGSAIKPGDILTISNGKTVEVDNTDAEGRLLLADALHYASLKKPDMIIDMATLTGAAAVALGEITAAYFTKYDEYTDLIESAGHETGEYLWRLPLWDCYKKMIESRVADLKNIGSTRYGGAIHAAKFLEAFVSTGIPWIHIDIAGPAMPNPLFSYTQEYMNGYGVRLLLSFMEKIEQCH